MNERAEVEPKRQDAFAWLKNGLSYARSLVFTNPLIYLYTGVMGTFSLVGSIVDSGGRWQHGCARVWSWLILKTSRIAVQVEGLENVRADRPTIYCVNHPSAMDIPILFVHLRVPFRFLSKRVLFHVPFLGWHLRRSGHIPVERSRPHEAMKSFELAVRKIREGRSVVLFPEGARSRGGTGGWENSREARFLRRLANGFANRLPGRGGAGAAGSDYAEWNSRTRDVLLPRCSYHVRPGKPEMIIHPPIETDGLTPGDGPQAIGRRGV